VDEALSYPKRHALLSSVGMSSMSFRVALLYASPHQGASEATHNIAEAVIFEAIPYIYV
jgi:hypothetical protein